ncbi:hypothetical protein EYF80_011820 [Liparis tanakae]|uniref:Uncharacterized protein n=1 Tax=Liparis tanakae TaxID=230148 RepID=A0A4Z2IJL0_9TELE|nr:hypothetical protein EYF80_011820 [Liparis tanakae]
MVVRVLRKMVRGCENRKPVEQRMLAGYWTALASQRWCNQDFNHSLFSAVCRLKAEIKAVRVRLPLRYRALTLKKGIDGKEAKRRIRAFIFIQESRSGTDATVAPPPECFRCGSFSERLRHRLSGQKEKCPPVASSASTETNTVFTAVLRVGEGDSLSDAQ